MTTLTKLAIAAASLLAGTVTAGIMTPAADLTCSVVEKNAEVVRTPCGHQWVQQNGMYLNTTFVSAPDHFIQRGTVYKCAAGYRFSPEKYSDTATYPSMTFSALLNNCDGKNRRQR